MTKNDPIVDFFDLEYSEFAMEWMDENGKIKDVEKLHRYLNETFDDPLMYVLSTFNEYLEQSEN
jgi:hypothetical protein